MPKGFSDREKEIIHQRLIEEGRRMFATLGIRKTSVEDLAKAAGISKGAFYLFYPAKEDLFVEILDLFERHFRESILAEIFNTPGTPGERLRRGMDLAFNTWRTSPLLTRFSKEEYEYLLRKIAPEKIVELLKSDDVFIQELVDRFRQEGVELRTDVATTSGIMKALFFASLHEEDFAAMYPNAMPTLVHIVTDYLIAEPPSPPAE